MKALTRKSHKICAAFAFIAAICVFAILFYFALAHGVSLSASDALSRSAKWSFKSEAAISQELKNEFSKIQNSSAKVDGFVWSGDDGLDDLPLFLGPSIA